MYLQEQPMGVVDGGDHSHHMAVYFGMHSGALQMSASSPSAAPVQRAARQYQEPQMTNPGRRFSLYYTQQHSCSGRL